MNYIFFEDQNTSLLYPFSLTHPIFELRCGIYNNLERLINNINLNENSNYDSKNDQIDILF